MLKRIENLPEDVTGVEAIGEVDAKDIREVLIPLLELQVERYDKINYLLVLNTEVKNWTAGSWIQDMWAGVKHLTKWNRIAVVTDEDSVAKFTDIFSIVGPGEAKGFNLSQLNDAIRWVSEES